MNAGGFPPAFATVGKVFVELVAQDFVLGLGGQKNILEVTPAYTRIRVKVASLGPVDEEILRAGGAYGVVRQKCYVQLIVGPGADQLAQEVSELVGA
ncbi:PTS transporter subunit EIIB [Arcanobacterium buesumense]|uniref:PTS transporter subunit EIIB n=2 Tax=Arcanobacterium buesumense TaxID=2722751 RepID=A0A6H2ENJ6_9ACTO|nr:PTS transporter subunit EIIB [Arcanobacterium buesumense]